MKKCAIILLFVASVWQLRAQDSLFVAYPPSKEYITTLKLDDPGKFPLTGSIIEVRDSSLILSPLITKKGFLPAMLPLAEVYAFDIESVRIQRKNRALRGALNGALIGMATGALIGILDGDDPEEDWFAMTAGEKALAGGIGFGILGGAIGAAIGPLLSVNIPIHGSLDAFRKKKPSLERYQLMTPTSNAMNLYPQ